MKVETIAIHTARKIDQDSGAVSPSICLSTTFERAVDGSYPHQHVYTRDTNPNRDVLEKRLCALEGGEVALAFSSGAAAALTVFQALSPGDHVIVPDDMYHGTRALFRDELERWGFEFSYVDFSDLQQVQQAIQENTQLIWMETPSNPMLKITDIAAVAKIASQQKIRCLVDNTWPTPILQRPFELGVDLILHSTTKYLGGHCDLLGGALISKEKDDFFARIRNLQKLGGAVPSPFDCWLLLRSIQTLPYRMRAHSENAMKVAQFLAQHNQIEKIHYPGLKGHVGHEIAAKQMSSFGGMLSIEIRGGKEKAMQVAAKVKFFTRATSLGGVESLIEHRASIEGEQSKTPQGLLRVSIGLEHPEDLIADLAQALET